MVFVFWAPKQIILPSAISVYYLLFATTATLFATTGNTSSPFVPLLAIAIAFSVALGIWGLLPTLITTVSYSVMQYVNGQLNQNEITLIAIYSIIPAIISIVLLNSHRGKETADDREYKNLASELTAVSTKSELVINAIGDGVMAVDGQGIIQLINPAAQSIVGWGKQDAMSLNYKSILQMVDQNNQPIEVSKDPIQQAINLNQEVRATANILTNSGKSLIVSIVASPVGDMGSGVIAVFRDITKEKAEEKEQAEFISTASHEMRTPVASIEGYLGLALNPQTSQIDEKARDFITKAQEAAKHLGRLFQDLLDVSKADDGRISNNPRVIDVVTFVGEIVQGLEQKAAEKGLKLVFKPLSGTAREKRITPVYYVNLDNDHIREVVNNLVENAIKYTPSGEVLIDIAGQEDHVVISIKDTGIGIPTEDVSHLFQKFYRVDNENTRTIGGTGLGLYLCRRLAELMGGRIWVESVYGSGSTFFLELPRVSTQEATLLKEQEQFKAKQDAALASAGVAPTAPITQANFPQQTMQPVFTGQTPNPIQSQPAMQTPQNPISIPVVSAPPTTSMQPQQPQTATMPTQTATPSTSVVNEATDKKTVPRSSSLTPEQIAAYVARQRELARQQSDQNRSAPTARTN